MVAMTVGLTVALYPSGAGATRPLSSEAAVGAGATVTVLPTVANPIATAVPSVESTATPPPATATQPVPTATARPVASPTPLPALAARQELPGWYATATALPDNPIVFLQLGLRQYKVGNYEEALRLFDAAEVHDPKGMYAFFIHFNRAPTLNLLGRNEEGLKEASKAIDLALSQKMDTKQAASAYNNRGLLYSSEGNFILALSDFTEGLKLSPDSEDLLDSRGDLYRRMGDAKSALDQLNKAIPANEQSDSAYYNRGLVYEELGQNDLAARDFEKEITTTNVRAYQERAASELTRLRSKQVTPRAG